MRSFCQSCITNFCPTSFPSGTKHVCSTKAMISAPVTLSSADSRFRLGTSLDLPWSQLRSLLDLRSSRPGHNPRPRRGPQLGKEMRHGLGHGAEVGGELGVVLTIGPQLA